MHEVNFWRSKPIEICQKVAFGVEIIANMRFPDKKDCPNVKKVHFEWKNIRLSRFSFVILEKSKLIRSNGKT